MALVEVIRGQATSDETTRTVMDLARSLDKTPVEVNDLPGFVANRVLPMINEAIFAVYEGVARPEAVDEVMKLGMNHPMGPLTARSAEMNPASSQVWLQGISASSLSSAASVRLSISR